jgi:hypothetical protein
MERRILLGAALAAVIGATAPAARADVLVDCGSLTTIGDWRLAGSCAIGGTIFTLGRSRSDVNPILVDFDTTTGVVVLTTASPDTDALNGAFSYTVALDTASLARFVEIQLFGVRQARAAADQGGALLSAVIDNGPLAAPTDVELGIGNNELLAASPDPLGAPPLPPDPALFDSSAIDARILQVVTRFNSRGNARDGVVGLESATAVYVFAAAEVPAPASIALVATGLALGAALRRRRR